MFNMDGYMFNLRADVFKRYFKLTFVNSFVKNLPPRFVKQLRKYPLLCIKGRKLETWHSSNTCSTETLIVKYVYLVI